MKIDVWTDVDASEYHAYLNGELVPYAFYANEEAHVILAWTTGQNGFFVFGPETPELVLTRLYMGKVEIRPVEVDV